MKKITLFIFTCLCLGSAFTQSRIDSLQAKENDSLGFIIPDTGNSRIVEINRLQQNPKWERLTAMPAKNQAVLTAADLSCTATSIPWESP